MYRLACAFVPPAGRPVPGFDRQWRVKRRTPNWV